MKEEYLDLIERYLNGLLSPEEKEDYEARLKSDPEFYDTHQVLKAEHDAMELLVAEKLKQDMSTWKDNPPPDPFDGKYPDAGTGPGKKGRLPGPWLWLLLLFVAVSVTLMLIPSKEKPASPEATEKATDSIDYPDIPVAEEEQLPPSGSNPEPETEKPSSVPPEPEEELYAYADVAMSFYEQPEYLTSTLKSGDNAGAVTPYQRAVRLYADHRLTDALKELGTAQDPTESNVTFLRGMILLEQRKYRDAANEFEKLSGDELLPAYEDARWYLLLSYAADLPDSRAEFDKLKASLLQEKEGYYFSKVQELSARIK